MRIVRSRTLSAPPRTLGGMTAAAIEPFIVADAAAWRTWLDEHENDSDGVWLALAKKGTTTPTSLTYAEALDEALCSGWIDGQKRSLDAALFLQRFTPRRRRSMWSARNVEHIARLDEAGRMRERGSAEVEAAQTDGRWEAAYAGSADMVMPDDVIAAMAVDPHTEALFAALNAAERYSIYHRTITARSAEARARRIAAFVADLRAKNGPQGA